VNSWICAQLGAREHYAIPRAVHAAHRLEALYTDIWAGGPWRLARLLGRPGKALAGRWHPGLKTAPVSHYPWSGLPRSHRLRGESGDDLWPLLLRQFQWFGSTVRDHLPEGPFPFFTYTGIFLEPAASLQSQGNFRILGQYDPAEIEEDLVRREMDAWPGWVRQPARLPQVPLPSPAAFRERRRHEWELADAILVNSTWSRQALIEQGVPAAKLHTVPLVFEPAAHPESHPERRRNAPFRVLFLGQVILRKGIQYLLGAAKDLGAAPVEFLVAGPVGISDEAIASFPENVTFLGPIPRTEVSRLYRRSDVFLLPTLSDGFALTQLEAMSYGLPVLATPNCGDVVRDGENGFVLEPFSSDSIVQAITRLLESPAQLPHLAACARETARQFGLSRLTRALLELIPS